jgi:hypothetical protein
MNQLIRLIDFNFDAESADEIATGHHLPDNEDWTVKPFNYGVVIESFEQAFIVTYSLGQSGNSPWSVTLMSVDGGQKHESGNCRTKDLPDAIEAALRVVTHDWHVFPNVQIHRELADHTGIGRPHRLVAWDDPGGISRSLVW